MIKFSSIKQIEHNDYPFEDAIASADTFNGAYGEVTSGSFSVGAKKGKVIMQIERGDDEYMPTYKIVKGEHVRVLDLAKLNGQLVEVYGDELPADVAKGDKLESDANGKLVKGANAAPYLEVTAIVGNHLGVEAKVVTA
ncbi:MAG: hypothetical protein MR384_11585 [Lachnospiraceae bacterium]|nr:hypothetical protein [Lachnospiraceae bacterium]